MDAELPMGAEASNTTEEPDETDVEAEETFQNVRRPPAVCPATLTLPPVDCDATLTADARTHYRLSTPALTTARIFTDALNLCLHTKQQRCATTQAQLAQLSVDSIIDGETEENAANEAMLDTVTELLRLQGASKQAEAARGDDLLAAQREVGVKSRALESLRGDLSSADAEARKWRLQLDTARQEFRSEKARLSRQNKELDKERARLAGKDAQYVAKLRKVESEATRLKDQLQKAQNPAKGRPAKGGVAMVRELPAPARTNSGRRGGDAATSEPQRFMDAANDAYTETVAELRSENEALRASLQTLQEELTDACNDALHPPSRATACDEDGDGAEGAAAEPTVLKGAMLLPVDLMQDGVEQRVRDLVTGVRELLSSAADTQSGGAMESPSMAQKASASLIELREQLEAEQTQGAKLQQSLQVKSDRLLETERMCALLRDQAHKQLGSSAAAEAIKVREEACVLKEKALEAEAEAVAEQTESNASAACEIDKQRSALEADTAAVAASLSAWERGSVGPAGTPLSGKDTENDALASPAVAAFLRRLSGISAPGSASKGSNPAGSGGRPARKSAKWAVTPHKTSTIGGMMPLLSPKVLPVRTQK